MRTIGIDPDCVDLAAKFLAAAYTVELPSARRAAVEQESLSEAIQVAIEDWFFEHPQGTRYVDSEGEVP